MRVAALAHMPPDSNPIPMTVRSFDLLVTMFSFDVLIT
jgi:hypothetical protein